MVPADLEDISRIAVELAEEKIGRDETYKVVVRRRLTSLSREEVIESIAPKIDRKVNLTNPDKILVVEIIGELAGVSVVEPREIFSSQKARRR